jgi:hypothetical protein
MHPSIHYGSPMVVIRWSFMIFGVASVIATTLPVALTDDPTNIVLSKMKETVAEFSNTHPEALLPLTNRRRCRGLEYFFQDRMIVAQVFGLMGIQNGDRRE